MHPSSTVTHRDTARDGPRVEGNLAKEVRTLAIREGRTFNDLLEEVLCDLVKEYRNKGS